MNKALIIDLHTDLGIEVMFNPNEVSITRGARYAEVPIPGLSLPLQQYVRGEAETLTVELFLDQDESQAAPVPALPTVSVGLLLGQGVHERMTLLREMAARQDDLHAPSVVRFLWGTLSFDGVITQLQEKFTLFDKDGNATRARVTLTLKSYASPEVPPDTTQSPDVTKAHVVKQGDRLDLIALAEYGDPSLWRAIAEANDIDRPRELSPGAVLRIPALGKGRAS